MGHPELARATLAISSPLSRAIQTLLGAFPAAAAGGAAAGGAASEGRCPPIELWPLASEHLTDSCDIGSGKSELAVRFPWLDLSALPEVWWYTSEGVSREVASESREHYRECGMIEPAGAFEARIDAFVEALRARPEPVIAVFGHSDHFNALMERHGGDGDYWLDNAEVYAFELPAELPAALPAELPAALPAALPAKPCTSEEGTGCRVQTTAISTAAIAEVEGRLAEAVEVNARQRAQLAEWWRKRLVEASDVNARQSAQLEEASEVNARQRVQLEEAERARDALAESAQGAGYRLQEAELARDALAESAVLALAESDAWASEHATAAAAWAGERAALVARVEEEAAAAALATAHVAQVDGPGPGPDPDPDPDPDPYPDRDRDRDRDLSSPHLTSPHLSSPQLSSAQLSSAQLTSPHCAG